MVAVHFFKTPDKSYPRRCKTPQGDWINTHCWTLLMRVNGYSVIKHTYVSFF